MNREEHVIVGILVFSLYTWLFHSLVNVSFNVILFGVISTIFGSIIPDILEPPTHWTHRGLGHSKRALKFVGYLFVIAALLGLLSIFNDIFFNSYIISSFFLGYVAHLLADSTTTMGIPP